MSDIIVAKKNDDKNLGYMDLSGAVGSLGQIDAMDILPPLLGGTVALGATILVRKYGKTKPNLVTYAPLIGAAAGIVGSIPLYWWRGPRAVIAGAVTGVIVGGGLFAFEKISTTNWALAGIGRHVVRRLPGQVGSFVNVQTNTGMPALNQPTAVSPGGFDLSGFGANVT
jgi:hypothetical protein